MKFKIPQAAPALYAATAPDNTAAAVPQNHVVPTPAEASLETESNFSLEVDGDTTPAAASSLATATMLSPTVAAKTSPSTDPSVEQASPSGSEVSTASSTCLKELNINPGQSSPEVGLLKPKQTQSYHEIALWVRVLGILGGASSYLKLSN